jgi:epoxyqueuosine reductase
MRLEDRIKKRALELGAGVVGITRISEPGVDLDRGRLRHWLAGGFAGEMAYLGRNEERRADPRLSLPGARSLLAAGFDYGPGGEPFARNPGDGPAISSVGRVARYARGRDYHRVIPKRLEKLLAFIREHAPGANGRVYVDTGPVLERAWASRAGLGWVGKHSLLLRQSGGSWFLLGVLLLDIELEADEPAPDRCGECRRCLDACPTGAIIRPYTVDSRRCISYLTIELRTVIPRPLRPLVGDHIFGCDVCQDVCPWNRHAAATKLDDFHPREELMETPLAEWLELDEDEFRRRFAGSPIARAKRDGFLRNVCVALGNTGEPPAVNPLRRALLEDISAMVRAHAAWALGRIGGDGARSALEDAARNETDDGVGEEIRGALEDCHGAVLPPSRRRLAP